MIRRHITALRLTLMAADAISAAGLFLAISYVRFGPSGWLDRWSTLGANPALLAGAYAVAWVTALWLNDLYRMRARWTARSDFMDVLRSAVLIAVATFCALFILNLPDVSRLFLITLFAAQVVVTFVLRFAVRFFLKAIRARGYSSRFVLVVGTGEPARNFVRRLERHHELGLVVAGHLSLEPGPRRVGIRPVLGTVDQIEAVLHSHVIDEVAICLSGKSLSLVEPITRLCEEEGKIVRIPLDEVGLTLPGGRLEDFDGIPVLSLVYGPDRILSLILKRLLDMVGAAFALVLLSPLFLTVGLLVLLRDGLPVFFRQLRVGLHGRPFTLVKFRTMVPDAEERLTELEASNEIRGQAFKVTNDPRLSRTGRFLRRTSIDELPQLWNVLKGEMSLVGPRPPLPREVAGYDVWHRRRLSMKPGITGLWQVQARREEEFDRWVELDIDYIDRWSIWLDLKIMLKTIPAILTQEGR